MNNKLLGFTFIELLVAIGIISLCMPVFFSLFLANLRTQVRILALQQTKQGGDFALTSIQSIIRQEARSIHSGFPPLSANEKCVNADSVFSPSDPEQVVFKDIDGNAKSFYLDGDKIAYRTDNTATGGNNSISYITGSKIAITSWQISCSRASIFTKPIVIISFTASYKPSATQSSLAFATLNFYSSVLLRN